MAQSIPSGRHGGAPSWSGMLRAPHQLIALVLGAGLSPAWPGTVGTLAGFGLFVALAPLPWPWRAAAYLAAVAAGAWASARTGADLGKADHNAIVVDEAIGMSLTLECVAPGWIGWGAAFLLFRLFDVWKPWPVNLPHRHGGAGLPVILDDVLAAAYAGLAAHLLMLPFA